MTFPQCIFVEQLDFGGNGINGTLPSELGEIESLVAMDMGNNLLTGSMPTEFGNLISLGRYDSDGALASTRQHLTTSSP